MIRLIGSDHFRAFQQTCECSHRVGRERNRAKARSRFAPSNSHLSAERINIAPLEIFDLKASARRCGRQNRRAMRDLHAGLLPAISNNIRLISDGRA